MHSFSFFYVWDGRSLCTVLALCIETDQMSKTGLNCLHSISLKVFHLKNSCLTRIS